MITEPSIEFKIKWGNIMRKIISAVLVAVAATTSSALDTLVLQQGLNGYDGLQALTVAKQAQSWVDYTVKVNDYKYYSAS